MKKIYLLPLLFSLFITAVSAQQLPGLPASDVKRCATAELLENYISTHPGAETTAQFESWINQKIAERKANPLLSRINPTVTIPVVFHIIHDNEAVGSGRNIAQNLVVQQVLQLNKDFSNTSNSKYDVAQDMGIRFALAQNDPNGFALAEPGIDRIDRNAKGWTAIGSGYTVGYASSSNNYLTNTIKPNSIWDPSRYLNIWVSQFEAGILGIATFPASSGLPGLNNSENDFTAGVSVNYTTLGSVFNPAGSCTGAYGRGRTLTHELGHFFGLRHIWGDSFCGTDYCDDTPTHQASNSGEPQHPKANSCGTADEQFENYMDYCNDIAMNTFTINQGDRMTAVFANSPRRASLATSNAGLVQPTGTNRIAFGDCDGLITVSEASGSLSCPKYRDFSFQVNVEDRATAATTVTVVTGGTAVNGVDYILMTPTLNFAAGDQSKGVDIRIIDDGAPTGNKTIILSYTIGAGGGVVAGSTAQTMTITLLEDDAIRSINNTATETVLLSENFESSTGGAMPTGWIRGSFGTAGPNVWTINSNYGAATGFNPGTNGKALHVTNGSAADQTAELADNAYTMTTAANPIAITKSINTTGYKNIKLTFEYASQGELVGSTLFDVGRLRYTTTTQTSGLTVIANPAGITYYYYNTPGKTTATVILPAAAENVANLWIGFEWVNNASGGTNPPFIIDNVVVTGDAAQVETVLNQTVTQSQNSGQSAQYSTASNKVITTLVNPNQNIGCLTATISGAGNARTTLNTTAGSYFRSDKVISLIPATPNTTASYQATFYYTTAELAAWGAEVSSLKMLKVKDGVNLGATLSAADASIFTPVIDDQRSTAGFASFTINATGGFSQFMLASPLVALPVNLLSFQARPNGKAIVLNWSTATETNNDGFAIERSADGVSYEAIGWTKGAGNSSRQTDYTYIDQKVQPGILYYYRLRQKDLDQRELLSEVKQARIAGEFTLKANISPNPASNELNVFVAGLSTAATINLVDVKGRLVKSWTQQNIANGPKTLDVSAIAPGVYLLQVITADVKLTEKVILQ